MTSTSPASDTPASGAPKRRKGPVAFLFRTALGCTAFGLGCLVALILLLPTLLGGTVAKIARKGFDESFHGSIEIAEADLAWFSEQRVSGVVVFDPEKQAIGRASIVLPSLVHLIRSGKTNIGRVTLEIDADLVQNDAGVTNLQRALEPRSRRSIPDGPTPNAGTSAGIEWLSRLELDLEVTSKRLTWSDAETRRVALPFEVREFGAHVTAHPGAAIHVHANGLIVAEQPGTLELDLKFDGPITSKAAWPFGRVDAQVRIEGFSTAMVDGIANLQGNLKEILGERFALNATVTGATASAGAIDLTLVGDRASLALEARFEDGALRSGDRPGLVATFPAPRGFLKTFVESHLPAGTELALDANVAPWRIEARRFILPLPPSGATDLAGLRPALERVELEIDVAIPGDCAFQNDATRAASVALSAGAIQAQVRLAPNAPLSAHFEAVLRSGASGRLVADVSARDAWAGLAEGALPIVDARARATGLSTAAIGALVGQPDRLPAAFGRTLDLDFDAREVSLAAGAMTLQIVGHDEATERMALDVGVRVADGLARIDGQNKLTLRLLDAAQWIEHEIAALAPPGTEIDVLGGSNVLTLEASDVVIPLPAAKNGDWMSALRTQSAGTLRGHLAGAQYTDESLRASKTSIALKGVDVETQLRAGGAATLTLRSDLQQGSARGQVVVDASVPDAWRFKDGAAPTQWPPIDAQAHLEGIPSALMDVFVQRDDLVRRVLGDEFSLTIAARGASAQGGSLSVRLDAPFAHASFAGHLDGGVFRASGEEGLVLDAKVRAAVLRNELAAFLPAGSALTWPNQVAEVTLRASDIAVSVPDFVTGQDFDLASELDALAAHVQLRVAGVGFENAHTRASKLDVGARDLAFDAVIAPKAPLTLKLTANLTPGTAAKLAVDATLADPFALARGEALRPIDAKVGLAGLDTRVLEALAGQDGILPSLLGPTLRLSIDARGASLSSGALVVDAASPTMTLHAATHFDDLGLHCSGEEGIDAKITPEPAAFDRYVKSLMPAGSRLQLAPDAGALTVKLRDVDIALAMSEPAARTSTVPDAALARRSMLERLSRLALKLDASLPALVYSDASTDAAQRPVTLRDVRFAAEFAAGRLPSAQASAVIEDQPPGAISAAVRALDPLSKLNDPNGIDTFRANVDVRAANVPTAILDVIAGQGGLLVEALGTRVDLSVNAPEISKAAGPFSVDMHSDLHSVKGRGHLDGGTLVVDEVDGLVATLGLGPVMSQRVVGKLLPTMVNVQKAADASPAKFSVDALRFPLDGNLRNLDGLVRIDLGEVNYALFPKLAAYLGESAELSSVRVPALTVPIQKGVAGYQRLPVKIGSREYVFSGTYDIVTDAALLTANVPVKLLGKKVSADLERVREYIDPDLTLPLTIRGSLVNPSIGLDGKALEKVLKDAGAKALGKIGGDLFKKKKKD